MLLLYAHLALLDSQGQPFVKVGVDPEYVAFDVQVYVCKFLVSIEQGGGWWYEYERDTTDPRILNSNPVFQVLQGYDYQGCRTYFLICMT